MKIKRNALAWASNPYYIWLSEVMLQQTQVKTVIDYYHKFISRFPTIEDLSQANEDEVLKYWEGLGYYSRARNFHTAVKEVASEYKGVVPSTPDRFGKLKGVGPYTQAAVLSIAFNKPLATVDGNVFRVWSRLNNDDEILNCNQHERHMKRITALCLSSFRYFQSSNDGIRRIGCT